MNAIHDLYICKPLSKLSSVPAGVDFGVCEMCQIDIVFQSYAPEHMKKICEDCATKVIDKLKEQGRNYTVLPGQLTRTQ